MSTTAAVRTPDAGPSPRSRDALRTWLRLLACSGLAEREIRRRLRTEFGTTLPRFDVLAQLDAAARSDVKGLTMSELSRRLMVTNGNLTGLVESLVKDRLVSRTVSPADRRIQLVRLTPAGRRALNAMTPPHERWVDDFFSGLSDDERSQLHHLLGRLRESVRASISEPAT